jgi:hypothetical protein
MHVMPAEQIVADLFGATWPTPGDAGSWRAWRARGKGQRAAVVADSSPA